MKTNDKQNRQSLVFCPKRRKLIKNLGILGASGAILTKAPFVFAKRQARIKILGTGVTLQQELRRKAMEDLGINIIYETQTGPQVLNKAMMAPSSFDIYEQWSNSISTLWQSGSIQPIDKKRITHWDEINNLTKTGKITPEASYGVGDAPYKILHVQKNQSLGSNHTEQVSFLPYVHNVDSFGYNTMMIPQGDAYQSESWGWLLDKKFAGKVGIINNPSIGLFDLAMAAQAQGLMQFNDIGMMSERELDQLFDILMAFKRQNHFGGFWRDFSDSIKLMSSNRVIIQSMFSPAVSILKQQGVPVTYAAPKEGFRGWHGVMCLSSATQNRQKDIAYEYLNWWLSGWPGAYVARQGYYIPNPERSAKYLSQAEWDYWYQGKPAAEDLQGTDGNIAVSKGSVRNGGNYQKRLSHIAVWNTVMPTYDYSLQKWHQFIGS